MMVMENTARTLTRSNLAGNRVQETRSECGRPGQATHSEQLGMQ